MSEQQKYLVESPNKPPLGLQGITALGAFLGIKPVSITTEFGHSAGQPLTRKLKAYHPTHPGCYITITKVGPKPKLGAPTGRAQSKPLTKRQLQQQAEQWACD